MKVSIRKVLSTVCAVSLLVAAAPASLAWAADAPAAVSSAKGGTAVLPDGVYSVHYTMKKFGTDQNSVMHDYVINPGTLTVVQGKQYFSMTLKQSKETTAFKTELDGALKDVEVIGGSEEKNTRDVRFEVKDVSKKVKAWVKVEWAAINYFHDYDVDLLIDASSAKKTAEASAAPGGNSGPASAPGKAANDPQPAPGNQSNKTAAVSPTAAPKTELTDISNHWAKASIEQAVEAGIANGYDGGAFRPDGKISRAEFTVLISRALKLSGAKADLNYADVAQIPEWVKADLVQAVGAGIISSYEDNTFRPDRSITRAEIAVMIARALGVQPDAGDSLTFADKAQIPQWAYASVAAASKKGIVNGRDGNLFAPNAEATRAEAVTLILLLLKNKL